MAILEIKDLSFKYKSQTDYAIKDINLEIEEGSFVVVCGPTGCGKTTLLKLIKRQLSPKGLKEGSILYEGTDISVIDERKSVAEIGYVLQNPDNQIVTDKVWHELAFGMESLGEENSVIRQRVAEISGFFGISNWYHQDTNSLSGGQKQLLNLAAVMVMQPKVLLLDEPTSQLDPLAATEFINILLKINQELGVTIILVEHRLEELFLVASHVVLMDQAKVLLYDSPRAVGKKIKHDNKMYLALPTSVRIFNQLNIDDSLPLSVNEGRSFLKKHFKNDIQNLEIDNHLELSSEVAFEISNGYFKYRRDLDDVLNGLDIKIHKGEFVCILGANGAGKTTLLNILNGTNRLYRGKFRIWDKKVKEYSINSLYRNNIASLVQNPSTMFFKDNVYDELVATAKILNYRKEDSLFRIDEVASLLEITHLFAKHPYDLSGGEQQKLGIAKILLMDPKIILLDEPTKGLDAYTKVIVANILKKLQGEGKTIVMVSHDVEFAAMYASRCALFFDGKIISMEETNKFFTNNNYYTTAASRISKPFFANTTTTEMVIKLCKLNGSK